MVVIGIVLAAGALAAAVWAGAAGTALLAGHGGLHAGIGDALRAAFALPSTPTHPAAAWPAPARPQLQSALLYWTTTVAALVAMVAAAVPVARWQFGRRFGLEPRRR